MSDNGPIEYAFRGIEPLEALSMTYEVSAGGPMGVALALLRALVPLPQTVKGHLVIGLDFEMALLPPPAPPAPLPFLFVGFVDCEPGALPSRSAPMSPPAGDAKVVAWGLPATAAGKEAKGLHIPMGSYLPITSSFTPKLSGETKLLFGSASVDIENHRAVRLGELGMNCSFVGPVLTPTTRVLSCPLGMPVLTGGASVLDLGAAVEVVVDAAIEAFLGHLFDEDSFPHEFIKAYLSNVIDVLAEASDIATSGDHDAREQTEAKLLELFTTAPLEALESAAEESFMNVPLYQPS